MRLKQEIQLEGEQLMHCSREAAAFLSRDKHECVSKYNQKAL